MWFWFAACMTPSSSQPDDSGVATLTPTGPGTDTETGSNATPSGPVLDFGKDGVPQNVLVLSIDTTRRDRIGRYDGGTSSPFIDQLLREGVALDDHRSCSCWTGPSMMCATTGRNPLDLGTFLPRFARKELGSVAGALRGEGYATHLVTANPFFFGSVDALGFEVVEELDATAETVAARGLDALQGLQKAAAPWYLHLHFFDPHREYCPPDAYRAYEKDLPPIEFDLCFELEAASDALMENGDAADRETFMAHLDGIYRAEIRYTDDVIRGLWAELDARGALDDTLVVLLTDHGEQLLERGVIDHGFELFAEENKAVAGFWAKSLAPAAFTGPTQHEDIATTLFSLYGLQPRAEPSGSVVGTAPADRVLRLVNRDDGPLKIGVVRNQRQLTYSFAGARSLHHDDTDPAHLQDRYNPSDPDVVALWKVLGPMVKEAEGLFDTEPPVNPGP